MIGQTISHYRITGRLGSGGMGVVYKAEDTNLGRTVALKFLADRLLESEEHKRRFLREAKATAALEHPNICTVHDVGEVDGRVFLAMSYVDGQELRDKIKERPFKLGDALDVAMQAAEGLRAAHQRGVVHRDVKSSNLMLTAEGQVKVMDFGLAQLSDGSKLTQSDTVLGTPAYMSPEQALGQATDRRTDIWSLGVVLYEMVTGRLPFEGERDQAVVYSIINEPHEPITAVRAGVPLELDRIVAKALAKEAAERYQNLDDLIVDLRALRNNLSTGSQATASPAPSRRTTLWMGAAVAAVLLIGIGLNRDRFSNGVVEPPRLASIAVLPLSNFSGDPEQEFFSDGLTETLIASLAKIGGLKVISRTSVMRYKGTTKTLPEIARELGVDAVVEGSAQRDGDRVRITAQLIDALTDEHLWAETYDRDMADVLRAQSEIARAIAEQINIELTPEQAARLADARIVNPAVYEAYVRGMYYVSQNTPEGFEKGIAFLREAVDIDPADPLGYVGLAEGYVTLAHGGAGANVLPLGKAAAEQALRLEPDNARAIGALADIALYFEWDWDKAEDLFERALTLDPNLAMTHYHYAWYLALFDRLDEAIVEHKLARDHDPLRPLHTAWLGGLYNYGQRYDEAIAEAEKAIELNPAFPPTYLVLANAYTGKGMHEEAIAAAQRFASLTPPDFGNAYLALTYADAGQRDEALRVAAGLDQNNRTSPFLYVASMAYTSLGDHDTALRLLEVSYETHNVFLPWVRVANGRLDGLFDDPRFQDLLERMNLAL